MPVSSAQARVDHPLGMHARPAMGFVDLAGRFGSVVKVSHDGYAAGPVDGKSIMHLMMLAATQGTVLNIEAEGDDAEEAIGALCAYVRGGFEDAEVAPAAE